MSDRPRVAVVVYGSILHPDDLADLFGDIDGRVAPVRVSGFRRVFDQEASWRETAGSEKAVLNVKRSDDDWFNGVLVADLDRSEFKEFRERERGYHLVEVEREMLDQYDPATLDTELVGDRLDVESQDLVLTTTGDKTRADIDPIESYVELCREGASQWGSDFAEDFLRTTELTSGTTLADARAER